MFDENFQRRLHRNRIGDILVVRISRKRIVRSNKINYIEVKYSRGMMITVQMNSLDEDGLERGEHIIVF